MARIYGALKAGLAQMAEGFASEVGRDTVGVNAMMPSGIETRLTASLKERRENHTEAAHMVFNR